MNDVVIIKTHRTRLRWQGVSLDEIEWDVDTGDAPVIGLGTEVRCGIGAKALNRKMGVPKHFKGQRGPVVIVHLETTPDARPSNVELGVMLQGAGVVWFSPSELELARDLQEISHAS